MAAHLLIYTRISINGTLRRVWLSGTYNPGTKGQVDDPASLDAVKVRDDVTNADITSVLDPSAFDAVMLRLVELGEARDG